VSPTHGPPPFLSWMTWKMKCPGQESKTAVVAGIITDDVCVQVVPKPQVCALRGCRWAAIPRATFSMLGASSSPLTSWPWGLSPKGCEVSRYFAKAPGTFVGSHTQGHILNAGGKLLSFNQLALGPLSQGLWP
uniref:Large ribosomal subunit protein uL15/eL18 domain-containing protein n=1 Tax=Bos mutus grunniens TaxID=30521 RepID=A0A8B9W7S9_BOSMU